MGKIQILSDQIINQIAAGEVIENPASVVKELVENAIDAGAKHIAIEVKGGGLQLIRVVDNGCGMSPEDALLSLERHATSKLSSADDLFSLITMGFRGEALASIAAISKFTLVTATEDVSTKIDVEGGEVISKGPSPRTRGTTVEVRSLFFNVPARKKFQKSASICGSEISKTVAILSLAHPDIGFELVQQDRPALVCEKTTSLLERLGQVLGEPFCRLLSPVDQQEGPIKISGYIGTPEHTRHNRTGQYLYINRRPVSSPLVSFAVRDGFGTRLASDRHPVFVLHLEVQPSLIDVNVHPQKREVRLREEDLLKKLIKQSVETSFKGEAHVVQPFPSFETFSPVFKEPLSEPFEMPLTFREEAVIYEKSELPIQHKARVLSVYSHFAFIEEEMGRVLLVDLHAARARIAFDSLTTSEEVVSQGLIIPITLELPLADAETVLAHLEEINNLGMAIRPVGKTSFLIDALPSFLDGDDAALALYEMAEELRRDLKAEKRHKLALVTSRFTKQKSYMPYEAEAIYQSLKRAGSPRFAPDGSPIMTHLKKEDLSTLLSRQT